MARQEKSGWKLAKVSDIPMPTADQLQELRVEWVNQWVWFFDRACGWRLGLVTAISDRGLVKIAAWSNGAWVYDRTIVFSFIPRVLRHVSE